MNQRDLDVLRARAASDPAAAKKAMEIVGRPSTNGRVAEAISIALFVATGVVIVHAVSPSSLLIFAGIFAVLFVYAMCIDGAVSALVSEYGLGNGNIHIGRRYVPVPVGPVLVIAYGLSWHLMLAPGPRTEARLDRIATAIESHRDRGGDMARVGLLVETLDVRGEDPYGLSGYLDGERERLVDGWGRPILYKPGLRPGRFQIVSAGPDGRIDAYTGDDITRGNEDAFEITLDMLEHGEIDERVFEGMIPGATR